MSQTFPGGAGPAGWDPVAQPSETEQQTPTGSPVYEPRGRDFAGENGKWDQEHWIDQHVDLALFVEQGSVKSAPEVGHTLRQIQRLNPVTIQADVEDRIKQALSRLLETPVIEILSIDAQVPVKGQLRVAVVYRNLRTNRTTNFARTYNAYR